MENYIVSARKYRPSTFDSVVGQRALTTTLKNAIATGKLAHAYLFCGPRGVGKTTCARIFAKTINCLSPKADGEACNQCESCLAFNEQRSLNIHELDAASNNSVEEIRALIEKVRIPPVEYVHQTLKQHRPANHFAGRCLVFPFFQKNCVVYVIIYIL